MTGDLRGWLSEVKRRGWLRDIKGISWDCEMGAALELFRKEGSAVLFDQIPGYPDGYRVLANSCRSAERIGFTLNIDPPYEKMRIVSILKDKLKNVTPLPYKEVAYGSILENYHEGNDINLLEFPAPKWNPLDGGRFIGTGCSCVTQDPKSGWVNVGTYRVALHDERTAGILMSAGRHGRVAVEEYWRQGKPCPVAIVLGQHPLLFMMSGVEIPYGVCEYDIAGALAGEPVEVIRGPLTGLPIPSNAEVVIEGEIPPNEFAPEGPFGEYTGYYASGSKERPIVKVKSILHRNDPILLGAPPGRPPSDNSYYFSFVKSAAIWEEIEKAGLRGIKAVWEHEAAGGKMFLIVAIKQAYPGHAKQVGLVASSCQQAVYSNHVTMVVDDDINPTDNDDLIWALATRTDFREGLVVVNGTYTGMADPLHELVDQEILGAVASRIIIDACKKWGNSRFVVADPDKEIVARVAEKLGLKYK